MQWAEDDWPGQEGGSGNPHVDSMPEFASPFQRRHHESVGAVKTLGPGEAEDDL